MAAELEISQPEPYWCTEAPNVPRVFSASSLNLLQECPRKFQYQYVEGWTPKQGVSLDFEFGILLHRGLWRYWYDRFLGLSSEGALDASVHLLWSLSTDLPAPSYPKQQGKTQKGLINALVSYVDHYIDVDTDDEFLLDSEGNPVLEKHFTVIVPLTNPDGESYQLQGYLDSLRTDMGDYTVWDYKSTGGEPNDWYFDKFEMDLQVAIYNLAARTMTSEPFTKFMVDVIGIDTRVQNLPYKIPVAFFRRRAISLDEEELDEYIRDIQDLIKSAERFAENNYWPKNTSSCRFCEFKDICNKAPRMRETYLKSTYKQSRRTTIVVREEE